jgi:hypothetical protein
MKHYTRNIFLKILENSGGVYEVYSVFYGGGYGIFEVAGRGRTGGRQTPPINIDVPNKI